MVTPARAPEPASRTIALDLDGVLADLASASQQHLELATKRSPTLMDWWRLRKVDNLFANLYLLPGALELYHSLRHHDVLILTARPLAVGKLATAAEDKRDWVHSKVSPSLTVITVAGGGNKGKFAKPGDVLIDDLPRNIRDWESAGGIGILHTSVTDTLQKCWSLGLLRVVKAEAVTPTLQKPPRLDMSAEMRADA